MGPSKILVMEDDLDLQQMIGELLEAENYQPLFANNGHEGLEILKTQRVATVISDIMMPEMTGVQCLSRAREKGINTPFVFLTGYGTEDLMLQSVRLGAVDFLSKPFRSVDLIDVITRSLYIEGRQRLIEMAIAEKSAELADKIKAHDFKIQMMRAKNNLKRIS